MENKMYISYEYYRAFYYVAKYGSVSVAAKETLSSQPNLTRTIKTLESELGCPLFFRTNRGMNLTPEGERLYEHIKNAVAQIEAGENEINESKDLRSGKVFIAASEVALRCLLLPILKEYRSLYPGIKMRISNYSTPQAINALLCGKADIAVVSSPTASSDALTETAVKKISDVAVCPPEFTALCGADIPLRALCDYPLIALGSDTKSFEFFSAFFESVGLEYSPDIEAFTADQILPLAEAGLGVGFIPRDFVKSSDGVRIIDLKESVPERSVCLIKRAGQPLSVAAATLEKMILDASK